MYLKERMAREKRPCLPRPGSISYRGSALSRKTKLFQKMMYCSRHEEINYRAVQLLTLSDRVQHNHEIIVPALKAGKIVLCDRYLYTSVANMLARGYRNEAWFFDACQEIVKPDLAFLAYVEPSLAIRRIKSRPEECDRHLNEKLLYAVAGEFLAMREVAEFHTIDTSCTVESAFGQVKSRLDAYFEEKR